MKVSDLYKVDMLAFNTKIGYITNLGTTFYAMQAQYPVESPEYQELSRRLKLCCVEQNRTIDSAKGLKTKPFPKHWTQYQKINEDDTPEEKARKEFENRLVIDKRPEFMQYLYPQYAKQYKDFKKDFDLYSHIKFGLSVEEIRDKDNKTTEELEMLAYYDRKNPLLESDSVMNKVSRHMKAELSVIKPKNINEDTEKIFNAIYNWKIPVDNDRLALVSSVKKEYDDFRKSKQLKSSEFATYDQYYKALRNRCLETISSNMQELANLAVYLCYKLNPTKPKDFCWDVFGAGIVENLKTKKGYAMVPHLNDKGWKTYLGDKYSFDEVYFIEDGDDLDITNIEIDENVPDEELFEDFEDF